MVVLDGNIPRFLWEPSTTRLNYRLGGTTEASVSYRNGPHHSRSSNGLTARDQPDGATLPPSSPTPARTEGALSC